MRLWSCFVNLYIACHYLEQMHRDDSSEILAPLDPFLEEKYGRSAMEDLHRLFQNVHLPLPPAGVNHYRATKYFAELALIDLWNGNDAEGFAWLRDILKEHLHLEYNLDVVGG